MITHFPNTSDFMSNCNGPSSSGDSHQINVNRNWLSTAGPFSYTRVFNVTLIIAFNSRLNDYWDERAEPPTNNSVTLIVECKQTSNLLENCNPWLWVWKWACAKSILKKYFEKVFWKYYFILYLKYFLKSILFSYFQNTSKKYFIWYF